MFDRASPVRSSGSYGTDDEVGEPVSITMWGMAITVLAGQIYFFFIR